MPRKKPASAKQRKAQLQIKRAVKRGDLDPEQVPASASSRRHPHSRSAAPSAEGARSSNAAAVASARRLQSAFVKLSPSLLDRSKELAANVPLPRPISPSSAIWRTESGRIDGEKEADMRSQMSCLRRPKWRYEMTKNEVEKNEEGVFAKWLTKMDDQVDEWVKLAEEQAQARAGVDEDGKPKQSTEMPMSPTIFERNLEVWRQLWRVTELSQIMLLLLDSRCPLLHLPSSLSSYLSNFTQIRLIFVLTKVDISGPERAEAWAAYLRSRYPTARVVLVEAYIQTAASEGATERKRRFEPHIPQTFKERLVVALIEAHLELLQPPERIRNDQERLQKWKPRVKREIDWDAVLKAGPTSHVSQSVKDPQPMAEDQNSEDDDAPEPDFLTVGVIGQPNVGKSSLLNALFGTTKVRASSTPGKTKHFQTLFWTSDIRLVDCPGLVMPDLVPLEMQVLSGILPIARMPAIPLCIHFASQLLPLERILGLVHPSVASPPPPDKRTWREGMQRPEESRMKEVNWTGMDILSAYADKKGWVTAKAGRPDVNRAGNAILRALADGKIRWAFWPPDVDPTTLKMVGNGIWMPVLSGNHEDSELDESEEEGSSDEEEVGKDKDEDSGDDSETLPSDDEGDGEVVRGGRFALLNIVDEEEGDKDHSNDD
ncbi:P-loop containing nucleoside triphosphate hydrolase protein [Auriscalpium vulgare]|uniref:P-loop containing nucleoside triphosphate hydrolase protein n=1 Tax=Auriscalpium vulgare TaxID=40419 RepID=A0ACB8RNV3_9AGAM|nr:P-loop containing nucleoside triphosphate hydrolase protein [Auriscalpium vulgare]